MMDEVPISKNRHFLQNENSDALNTRKQLLSKTYKNVQLKIKLNLAIVGSKCILLLTISSLRKVNSS